MLEISKDKRISVSNTPCEWVEYQDGVKFEIYGISHPFYLQAQLRVMQKTQGDILDIKDDVIELNLAIIGQYLVKDWQGIVDKDGNELPKTAENFVDLVTTHAGVADFILLNSERIQESYYKGLDEVKKKPSRGGSGRAKK